MPNRILKESVCTSESVDSLTWFEEVFFYRLIVNCDDYGRFDARPAVLKARLFPLKERITLKDVSGALTKLSDLGIVRLYKCDGKPYLNLMTWEVHQTIRAKKSRYPDPKASEIICNHMQAGVPVIQSNPNPIRESESNPKEKGAARFIPPSVDEVKAYCEERKNQVDPDRFVDFYTSKGWKVGANSMKDWKAAVRNWERGRERNGSNTEQPSAGTALGTTSISNRV